jgi:hypothetical protein
MRLRITQTKVPVDALCAYGCIGSLNFYGFLRLFAALHQRFSIQSIECKTAVFCSGRLSDMA